MSPAAQAPFAPDTARFLRPLSLARPAGEPLLYDPVWARIREARREDDPSVPQGQWQKELKRADWKETAALCLGVLETRSRDLQVAGWLLEAWIHLHGFAGAREGLRLIHALCEFLWEHLHPAVDPDDPDVRSAPFAWINDRLGLLLARVPLTAPEGPEAARLTWADWQEALRREGQPAPPAPKRGDAPPEPPAGPTRARFAAAVSLTPTPFYRALADDLEGAVEAAQRLQALLDQRAGPGGPTLSRFTGALERIRAWVAGILAERPEAAPQRISVPFPEVFVEHSAPGAAEAPPAPRPAGPITGRDEAYRRLSEAAEYLLRTEPHSPTPFLVQRAVAWGGMSLSELIGEFLRDGYDLKTLRVFLGLDAPGGR